LNASGHEQLRAAGHGGSLPALPATLPSPSHGGYMTDRDPHTRIQRDIVDALLSGEALNSDASRQLFVDRLSDLLGGPLPVRLQPTVRLQMIEIVRTCAKRRDGLAAIVDVAAEFDPVSPETVQLQQLRDEWDAVTCLPSEDWTALRSALENLVVPDLPELCRLATASRVPTLPARCTTPWLAFVYLAGAASAPDMLPPWMALLDLVAEWMEHEAAREVRARNQQRAVEWGLLGQLDAVRWELSDLRQEAAPTAYLVIQLDPDPLDRDRFTLSYWHQADPYHWRPVRGEDRFVRRTELQAAVADLVGEMEAAWSNRSEPVVLEFILPWELLNAPVEWWPKDLPPAPRVPLTRDYPVVVRSLDRLGARPWHRVWHQRWSKLEQYPATGHVHWSRPAGEDHVTRLREALKNDEHVVSMVLSEPPHGDTGRDEMKAALSFGLPVVVWHRTDCSTAAFRQTVADLLADGGLAHLPTRARDLRLEALRLDQESQDQHVGRHLAVLWDDPRRQPKSSEWLGGTGEGLG
jgi:hypothetical protein